LRAHRLRLHETAFFDGYRAEHGKGHASDPIRNVTRGDKIVVLRIYVDNDAQVDEGELRLTTAYNTCVHVYLPSTTAKSLVHMPTSAPIGL
jgi:hypothetical protein